MMLIHMGRHPSKRFQAMPETSDFRLVFCGRLGMFAQAEKRKEGRAESSFHEKDRLKRRRK
jgi:hypothetical protein